MYIKVYLLDNSGFFVLDIWNIEELYITTTLIHISSFYIK